MSIQQRNAFVCSDGTTHWSMEEAQVHENLIKVQSRAEEYRQACVNAGLNDRTASRRASTVALYLAWEISGQIGGPEPAADDNEQAAA